MIKECVNELSESNGFFVKGEKYIISFYKGMYLAENKKGQDFYIGTQEYKKIFGVCLAND